MKNPEIIIGTIICLLLGVALGLIAIQIASELYTADDSFSPGYTEVKE